MGNRTPPSNQLQAQMLAKLSRIRKIRELTSWVWGHNDNPNSKVVLYESIQYWQCTKCSQQYLRIYGTTHFGEHLDKVYSMFEQSSTKAKRLHQAQSIIEQAMINSEKLKIRKETKREKRIQKRKKNTKGGV